MTGEALKKKISVGIECLKTHALEFHKVLGMATIGEAPSVGVRRRWCPPPGPD